MDESDEIRKAIRARIKQASPPKIQPAIRFSTALSIIATLFIIIAAGYWILTGDSCKIKGNISRDKSKIYYMPGHSRYSQVKVSPKNGEQWFCSEQEAIKAGWQTAPYR